MLDPLPANQSFPLRLILYLNTTRLISGQSIDIWADIYNTLPRIFWVNGTLFNEASSNYAWPPLLEAPCLPPVSIMIIRGHYTKSSLTEAKPLPMYEHIAHSCTAYHSNYYLFLPLSNEAVFRGGDISRSMGGFLRANGYYSVREAYHKNSPFGVGKITPFEPGTYTVVAGDEWGQLALGYFEVVSP